MTTLKTKHKVAAGFHETTLEKLKICRKNDIRHICKQKNMIIVEIYQKSSKNKDEDIISTLPDELLIKILSLLSDSDANQTRVLSKRWKNLYVFLPNLHFVMYPPAKRFDKFVNLFYSSNIQANKSHDIVDQALAIRGNTPIQRFSLNCRRMCDYDWLYTIIRRFKVQQLELMFPDGRHEVPFCWDLFKTWNTLVELNLNGKFVLDLPQEKLLFPCLKKMVLISIVHSSNHSFDILISGCPVLEELILKRNTSRDLGNFSRYMVSSPSLKRLEICLPDYSLYYDVLINAPKLEYIYLLDQKIGMYNYVLTEHLSLVEAHISLDTSVRHFDITYLSSVKTLTVTYSTIKVLLPRNLSCMPVFHNLEKLVTGIHFICHSDLLFALLNKMPNLEHITFSDEIGDHHSFNEQWKQPMEPPVCLPFMMKEIVIKNGKAIRKQQEMAFIRYLLEHSNNLEMLTLNAHNIDPKRREQLLNFQRGSLCRVKLIESKLKCKWFI